MVLSYEERKCENEGLEDEKGEKKKNTSMPPIGLPFSSAFFPCSIKVEKLCIVKDPCLRSAKSLSPAPQ